MERNRLNVVEQLWERAQLKLHKEYSKKKNKTKRDRLIARGLLGISEKARYLLIKDYIRNCKVKYLEALTQWHEVRKNHDEEFSALKFVKAFGSKLMVKEEDSESSLSHISDEEALDNFLL